jgi:uncharacterized protein YbjQ (UPF0145 family)
MKSQPQSFDPAAMPGAQQRLEQVRQGFVTSDLSTDEFVLLQQTGFDPLGMVVGLSVYHVGVQATRWNQSQELGTLSEAMHNARELALGRMVREAQMLGADGVVGTRLRLQRYVGAGDVFEFIAVGTAVRWRAQPGALALGGERLPFSSHLSGTEMVKLWRVGWVPTHFAFGVCVYHVAHQSIRQTMRQMGQNVEMPLYTQALYDARETAMGRVQQEAAQWGAQGLVGVSLVVDSHVWGEHAVEFLAVGTGVRRHNQTVQELPAVQPVIALG